MPLPQLQSTNFMPGMNALSMGMQQGADNAYRANVLRQNQEQNNFNNQQTQEQNALNTQYKQEQIKSMQLKNDPKIQKVQKYMTDVAQVIKLKDAGMYAEAKKYSDETGLGVSPEDLRSGTAKTTFTTEDGGVVTLSGPQTAEAMEVLAQHPEYFAKNPQKAIAETMEDFDVSIEVKPKDLKQATESEYPILSELMSQGWQPSDRITKPLLDIFESAAKKAKERGEPFTVQTLRDMDFNTRKNRATGQTAGGRLVISRKQNINTAYQLLDDIMKTNEKLDYSPYQFVGKLEKFKAGQLNDPVFTEYMTQRADSLFVLGNALKQNGLTDKSIEVEEEAFNPTLSPQAFKAWVNVQKRALNKAAEQMNEDYKFEIEQQPTAAPGTGGSGPKSMETPKIKFMGFE